MTTSIHPTPYSQCMTVKGNSVRRGKKGYNMTTFLEQSICAYRNTTQQQKLNVSKVIVLIISLVK